MTKSKTASRPAKGGVAAAEPNHKPTPRQIRNRTIFQGRNDARPLRPESASIIEGGCKLVSPAKDQDPGLYSAALLEAFGTTSLPFLNDSMDNITRAMSAKNNATDQQMNAAVAILAAIEPANELEATIGVQIVCANEAANRCFRAMVNGSLTDHHKLYGDLANKFLRTSAALVDSLARLRRNGEQVVKHIHVHEGGQAVVAEAGSQTVVAGTINNGGRGARAEGSEQPYGAAAIEECAALRSQDETGNIVPIAGHAERALSPAWGEVARSTEGQ